MKYVALVLIMATMAFAAPVKHSADYTTCKFWMATWASPNAENRARPFKSLDKALLGEALFITAGCSSRTGEFTKQELVSLGETRGSIESELFTRNIEENEAIIAHLHAELDKADIEVSALRQTVKSLSNRPTLPLIVHVPQQPIMPMPEEVTLKMKPITCTTNVVGVNPVTNCY